MGRTRKTEATCAADATWLEWSILDASVSPVCARAPPSHATVMCRVPPSRHTPHGSGWRVTQHGPTILSEKSSLSPGKRLHHQRSSSSHDASPHRQGERPAPVAGRKFSDIGYGIVGQRRCRTRRATRRFRRQIHQWGCRAPRLCERERRGLVRWGLCLEVLMGSRCTGAP
jgi:hypothetical protein